MSNPPLILAIDASTGPCSVAVVHGMEILAERVEPRSVAQSRVLVPMMQAAMQEAGVSYPQLTRIVSTIGPGSFTGIRIGLGMARAVGLAENISVAGVTCFETLAFAASAAHPGKPVACALNAGKSEYYVQIFNADLTPASEPALLTLNDAINKLPEGEYVLCGNVSELFAGHAKTAPILSDAQHPQARHAAFFAHTNPGMLHPPTPLYIRPPDAIIPAKPATAC